MNTQSDEKILEVLKKAEIDELLLKKKKEDKEKKENDEKDLDGKTLEAYKKAIAEQQETEDNSLLNYEV